MFIHGGYWQALSASQSLMPAPALTAAGRLFASVDYTLAPLATIGTMITQCVRAVEVGKLSKCWQKTNQYCAKKDQQYAK